VPALGVLEQRQRALPAGRADFDVHPVVAVRHQLVALVPSLEIALTHLVLVRGIAGDEIAPADAEDRLNRGIVILADRLGGHGGRLLRRREVLLLVDPGLFLGLGLLFGLGVLVGLGLVRRRLIGGRRLGGSRRLLVGLGLECTDQPGQQQQRQAAH